MKDPMTNIGRIICYWLLLSLHANYCVAQQVKNIFPIKGIQGIDYWIDYYVDHDTGPGIKDYKCGDKTYNSHNGTDFLIRSFKTMDSGVSIQAVTDGVVVSTFDGLFDRNTHWTNEGLGNYISIVLSNGYTIYYGHLKKNSIVVKKGDTIKVGQQIGLIGSSGHSIYPHLHLELHDYNRKIIDPFLGNCNENLLSLWNSELLYDTATYAIDNGFVPYIPGKDALLERFLVTDTFSIKKDTIICYWIQIHGLHKYDSTRVEWYQPAGKLFSEYSYIWKDNWWYDYTWFYISMPRIKGKWSAKYFVNNKLVCTADFFISK